jgi:chorismate synthase
MSGNNFGEVLKITTFGESHGVALGVVIDGLPAGLKVTPDDLAKELKRRAPGQHSVHTSRKEEDIPEILSGVFEGKTLGTPVAVIVRNTNQRSSDYEKLKDQYRPGHADRTTMIKYGFRDHRGGGRASGRETLSRVIGGYFAGLIIPEISFYAFIEEVAHFKLKEKPKDHSVDRGEINLPDPEMSQEVIKYLNQCKTNGDSAGGVINLSIRNCPAGLGEPVFDKLKADLAKAMLSLPACIGFSVHDGFQNASLPGSKLSTESQYFGGMEGGISNGEEICVRVAFKAPSTIGDNAKQGRHDPCILPRVVPVIESMAKLVIADHYLRQRAYDSFRA